MQTQNLDIKKAFITILKTGRMVFGTNNAIKSAKTGRAKLIIVASNCPQKIREEIQYCCKLSKNPVTIYKGTSIDLGTVCGKPFKVLALTIREPGGLEITELVEALNA